MHEDGDRWRRGRVALSEALHANRLHLRQSTGEMLIAPGHIPNTLDEIEEMGYRIDRDDLRRVVEERSGDVPAGSKDAIRLIPTIPEAPPQSTEAPTTPLGGAETTIPQRSDKSGEHVVRRDVGRPNAKRKSIELFNARRAAKTPLHKKQIEEAKAILKEWPSEVVTKPKERTVSGHISSLWQEADKSSDKL